MFVDDFLIYLDTNVDDDLLMERFSREVVSAIQQARKDTGLDVTDRIQLQIHTKDDFIIESIKKHESYIMNETLSLDLVITESDGKSEILNKNDKNHDKNVEIDEFQLLLESFGMQLKRQDAIALFSYYDTFLMWHLGRRLATTAAP